MPASWIALAQGLCGLLDCAFGCGRHSTQETEDPLHVGRDRQHVRLAILALAHLQYIFTNLDNFDVRGFLMSDQLSAGIDAKRTGRNLREGQGGMTDFFAIGDITSFRITRQAQCDRPDWDRLGARRRPRCRRN